MIVFLYEHHKTIGAGHYIRCKSVQETFVNKNISCSLINESEFEYKGTEGDIYIVDFFDITKATTFINKINKNNIVCTFDYFSNDACPDLNISVFEQFNTTRLYPNYVGLEYCIIRKEFTEQPIVIKKPKEIFVYIGGNGDKTIVESISKKLSNIDFKVKLIRNQNSDTLDTLPDNFEIHYLPSNLAQLMNESSFAITSPGLATMELLYLKVPSVLYPLNSLHEKFSNYFIENNLAICNYSDFTSIDFLKIEQVKNAGGIAIDGNGLERITNLIMHHYEQKMGHSYTGR